MNPARILRRSLVGAATLTVLVVGPAGAHPFITGGELPVDSLVTMRLSMAHGCGGDDGGAEAATTEVALEVPDWLRIVDVPDADGYTPATETAEDGTVTAVTWTVDGDGVPAPAFDLDVVASGTPGEAQYLAVFQGCGDDGYRWIGTPDEPADDPAVNVALVEADPDAPPPPPEETPAPAEDPTEDVTDEPTAEPTEDVATDDVATEDGGPPVVLLGGLVVVALAAAVVLASRRRGRGDA
ncbi:MAG TPA: hypothetical protein VK906_03200 [Egicoccus sp.]|nr:hypothetical protein [Egicoccus sp.]HSK22151.1 hypothetical protein [Egicoccus sp.]